MRPLIFILSVVVVVCFSCSQDPAEEPVIPDDSLSTVIFHFDHTVDGDGVVYDKLRYKNEAGNRYSVMTLKYYISDIRFHRYDGTAYHVDCVHYRDIAAPETRSLVADNIPDGEYAYISFIFGLDATKNISYSLPPTQENNNMEWPEPMGGGYHFMKLEGRYFKSNGAIGSYNTHTGRLETGGHIYENFIQVELPFSSITLDRRDIEIQVVMNLNEWYRGPNVYDLEAFEPAVMGNQEAQRLLKENGATAFSIGNSWPAKTDGI